MVDPKKSSDQQKKVVFQNDFELTTNSPDDPRSRKRWGYVTALPSEYLIHFSQGQINKKNSGQGATCFKYPQDTVFIIPTSLKEIVFQANQLTLDNVDVRIRGMAVYRIHDPLRIYKLINFSNRNRAEEKMARMIADMCRSTAKWLVANMKVDECIRKRKEEIAESLKKEVAHVVADPQTGWGLEIITIDIQDVYIQDEEIFSAMQMMFKSGKMRESKLAQLDTERELEVKKLATERSLAEDRKNNQLDKARIDAEIKDSQIMLAKQNEEKQFALDRYRVTQNQELAALKFQQEILQEQGRLQMLVEKAQKEAEAKRVVHQEELEALQKRIEVENSASPVSLEREFIEKVMPSLAQSLAQSMQNVSFNIMQQDGQGSSPFNFLLMQIMQIMKQRFAPLQKQEENK
jgi:regulator of protease activity HflC (stomatin/prohibitin superfamily)